MLKYPSRPSELCIFRDLFFNSDYVRDNGGTLVASPTVANGLVLNGTTQYASYPTNGFVLNGKTALTFEVWFTPTFAADDGNSHYIFDTTTISGGRCILTKLNTNSLVVQLGSTNLTAIALGTYQNYWYANKTNHIAICATSGSTLVYLNNNLIGTLATAWAITAQPATLYIGAINTGATPFAGTIHSLSIYATKWDANEVSDAYNKITFTEMAFNKAVVHLPCKSIYANTGDGVMLGTDMDMEAVGTASWTASNSATLSKETGTRTGGSGTKVLKVLYNGTLNPGAYQAILTANKYYRVTGWAQGDGTAIPKLVLGANIHWTGTSSTSWQSFDVVGLTSNANFILFTTGAGAGQYCQFDDVTVQEVDFLTENTGTGADVKVGDSGLYGVTQAQYNGFVYDGASSYLDCGSDVVGTSAGTFAAIINISGYGEGASGGRIFDNGEFVFRVSVASACLVCTSNGGVINAVSAAGSIALGVWNTVIVTRTSGGITNFYINGQQSGTANQASGTPAVGDNNLILGNNAARAGTLTGTKKYDSIWTNFTATPTQCREIHQKLLAMLNKG